MERQPRRGPALPITAIGVAKDWNAVDTIRKGVTVPVVLKGVMTAADPGRGDSRRPGDCRGGYSRGADPVLIDGGFRRGGDVLKALATGASAVLPGRPTVWALSAYGSEGVQYLLETTQTDLARDMAVRQN